MHDVRSPNGHKCDCEPARFVTILVANLDANLRKFGQICGRNASEKANSCKFGANLECMLWLTFWLKSWGDFNQNANISAVGGCSLHIILKRRRGGWPAPGISSRILCALRFENFIYADCFRCCLNIMQQRSCYVLFFYVISAQLLSNNEIYKIVR